MKKTTNDRFSSLNFNKLLMVITIMFFMVSCKKDDDIIQPWYPETNTNGQTVLAVYENRIPCPDCERLKLALVVYGNTQTNQPTAYLMSRIYVGKNNDRLTNAGDVNITQGTSLDSLHIVYQLTSGAPAEYQSFWKINEDLLFILDENLTPRVGDAGHGYVLNKIR